MKFKKLLACAAMALGTLGVAHAAPPADTDSGPGKGGPQEKEKRAAAGSRAASQVPVIPEVAARNPTAPPPRVVDRLVEVGASPVAVGVLRQLTDDEPLSPR